MPKFAEKVDWFDIPLTSRKAKEEHKAFLKARDRWITFLTEGCEANDPAPEGLITKVSVDGGYGNQRLEQPTYAHVKAPKTAATKAKSAGWKL